VFIGADSAGVDSNYGLMVRADRKLFRNGEFLIGFTDSFRMGQLLGYVLAPPKPREGADLFAYMVTDFVTAVRDCLKAGGYARRVEENERGGQFLVAVRGRLFNIEGDYQVAEASDGFDSVGCAADVALGALYATRSLPDPRARLTEALSAAQRFSAGVREPFVFEQN